MSEEKRTDGNGWGEYKRLILSELTRIAVYTKESRELMEKHCEDSLEKTNKSNKEMVNLVNALEIRLLEKIAPIQQEIASLKVKASIWGGVGGAVIILMALCVWLVQQSWASTLP